MERKMSVRILDCTLRDGGYINDWEFGDRHIDAILEALGLSNIEIVECGYLSGETTQNSGSTIYNDIDNVKASKFNNKLQKSVVMINYGDYDMSSLPLRSQSHIDGIRLAFHKNSKEEALIFAKKIISLGYDLYLQPMVTKNYNDEEYLSLLHNANTLGIYAFYIVDSFGSMLPDEFNKYMKLANSNLDANIALGYHSHNNMQLAFSNAISLCESKFSRDVIVDASIYGIGRGAGNLNTELIADYLNKTMHRNYHTLPMLEVIDALLSSLMVENPWGFSPAQYLSASYNCHPNYAKYLVNKNTNHIVGVKKVLASIPEMRRSSYDASLIEKLYIDSLLEPKTACRGDWSIDSKEKILLVASGSSMEEFKSFIQSKIKDQSYRVVALNHTPAFECDDYFFSNQKRYDEFEARLPLDKTVITDNISSAQKTKAVISLKKIAFLEDMFVKNVAIVAINYFLEQEIKSVEIAGLDGYRLQEYNYSYDETNVILDKKAMQEENDILRQALEKLSSKISISFVTPSIFSNSVTLKILGVIPARYKSTRFEGKPLCIISGIPMIKRTYTQAKKSKLLTDLVVATDSIEIESYCQKENIPVVMTSQSCLTGTDRLAEVALKQPYDLYVNIQGDEPIIDHNAIDEIVEQFNKYGEKYVAYNLYKEIDSKDEVSSDTIIKVITNEKDELMYMSRLPVPFNKSETQPTFKKQVCVYGFTKRALEIFSTREKTLNELHEDIEILRFVDMGYLVKMAKTTLDSIAVDVPADVKKVEAFLQTKGLI